MAWLPNKPEKTDEILVGLTYIQDNNSAIESTIGEDHNSMDQTRDGEHKKVTLYELASKPDALGTADKGYVYTKEDADGDTALFFENEDGDEVQMTANDGVAIAKMSAVPGADGVIKLGDAAGANKLSVTDSASSEVLSLDSDGKLVNKYVPIAYGAINNIGTAPVIAYSEGISSVTLTGTRVGLITLDTTYPDANFVCTVGFSDYSAPVGLQAASASTVSFNTNTLISGSLSAVTYVVIYRVQT